MKQIKRKSLIAILMLLTLGTAQTVFAQGQRPPRGQNQIERPQINVKEIVKVQMNWFDKNFELSEEQTDKIEEIHLTNAENRKAIMDSGLTPRDSEFIGKMEGIDITKYAELEEVLTNEQWAIFEKKKEEYTKLGQPERPQRRGKNGK